MAEKRLNWDEYFIEIVKLISKRSSCPRKQVGAIIVKNNRIIGSGYNGSPSGMAHCIEEGCLMKDGHCIRCIHAEQNALLSCKEDMFNATIYCTILPCPICIKLIIQAGIKKIVYLNDYNKSDVDYWIEEGGIEVVKWR